MRLRPRDTLTRVLPGTCPWPLFDVAATRRIEADAMGPLAPHELMRRAGLAVARLVLATHSSTRRVHAFAGPGNNGGDALVAAALLSSRGWQLSATLLGDADRLPADARQALQQAQDAGVSISTGLPARLEVDLALDGLLGIGASRPPTGALSEAIATMNLGQLPVLAIDLPSGLDSDRGQPVGDHAVHATHTLSLLTLKPGLFTAQGRDHAGQVWHDSLGVSLPASIVTLTGAPAGTRSPHDSHKGRFGDLVVVGGDTGMVGAAILAARSGLAAGAGRVFLCALARESGAFGSLHPDLMQRSPRELEHPQALSSRTVVCGCGAGEAVRDLLPLVLARSARLVLDADALNAIAAEPSLADALRARAARGRPSILTPHPLEAARLLGSHPAQVQSDRLANAQELARRFNCVVVLKGSGTVTAAPDGTTTLNPTGNALLATPGSGDVLAGWIGGAWARAGAEARPIAVASASVWVHGKAVDDLAAMRPSQRSVRASELPDLMRSALREGQPGTWPR